MRTARAVRAIALPAREVAMNQRVFVAQSERLTAIAWWEFESEVKRRYALELLLRKMCSLAPPP